MVYALSSFTEKNYKISNKSFNNYFFWFILTPRLFQFIYAMVASPLYSWVILLAYFFLLFPIGALIYVWTRKMTLRKALKGDLRKLSNEDLRDVLNDVLKN